MSAAAPKIEGYQFGQITVDGQIFRNDLILFPDRVLTNWWREKGHLLSIEDLQEVLAAPIRVLIVGSGAQGRMRVPEATLIALQERKVEVSVLPTAEACEAYNQRREGGGVAAALHLTC